MSKWQPIETAPKDGREVFLYFPKMRSKVWRGSWIVSETRINGEVSSHYERWATDFSHFGRDQEPTHWLPIPDGPDGVR